MLMNLMHCFLFSHHNVKLNHTELLVTTSVGTCGCSGAAEPASVGVSWWHHVAPFRSQRPHLVPQKVLVCYENMVGGLEHVLFFHSIWDNPSH